MVSRFGRILVVDDDASARTALAQLLCDEGYEIETAGDGFKALHKFESFSPHLVVTDLQMPGMDGIELTKMLRAFEEPPAVVVLTAFSAVAAAVEAMRAGAAEYLTKPLDVDELLVVIDRVLEHQQLRRENNQAQTRVREQLAFTMAMAGSLGEGTLAVDLEGVITFINEVGARLLGCPDDETLGKRSADLAHVETCEGKAVECPLAIAIRTGGRVRSDDHVIVRTDRSRFPASYTATPIRRDGRVTGAVIAFDDISERRRVQTALQFLLEAGVTLNASLESATVANAVVRLGVPLLGDLCFVDVVSADDHVLRVAWAHADPTAEGELDRTFGGALRVPVLSSATTEVIATGRSMLLPIVAATEWSFAPRMGIRSALIVPLTLGARQLGALTFCMTGDRWHNDSDIALAEELARRSALAIEHARLYEQAHHAIAMRDQMLAIVSHDLRSPLQTIVLASTLLGDELADATPSPKVSVVTKIQIAAARMQRMIEDLVDFASIEAGQLAIVAKPHAVAAIIDESIASFEARAKKRDVKLISETVADMLTIQCDRDRILQVIANLVGNALQIVAPGGSVRLSATANEREVVFSISDTGPGIAASDQKRLFERYWRSPDASYKGTGLGLAIARGIVETHQGRIWVESELGQGATFYFTLQQTEAAHERPAPIRPSHS